MGIPGPWAGWPQELRASRACSGVRAPPCGRSGLACGRWYPQGLRWGYWSAQVWPVAAQPLPGAHSDSRHRLPSEILSFPSQKRPQPPDFIDPLANKKPRISHFTQRAQPTVNGKLSTTLGREGLLPTPGLPAGTDAHLPLRLEPPRAHDPLADVSNDLGHSGRDCEHGEVAAPAPTERLSMPLLTDCAQPSRPHGGSLHGKSKKKSKKHKDRERAAEDRPRDRPLGPVPGPLGAPPVAPPVAPGRCQEIKGQRALQKRGHWEPERWPCAHAPSRHRMPGPPPESPLGPALHSEAPCPRAGSRDCPGGAPLEASCSQGVPGQPWGPGPRSLMERRLTGGDTSQGEGQFQGPVLAAGRSQTQSTQQGSGAQGWLQRARLGGEGVPGSLWTCCDLLSKHLSLQREGLRGGSRRRRETVY